jgi:undecaprenyl-diphosphatase
VKNLFHYPRADQEKRGVLTFLIISTVISGLLGFALIKLFAELEKQFELPGRLVTGIIGVLLLITAYVELRARKNGHKDFKDLKLPDGIILGIAQGFAALPGLSRSGLTVAALLLRKYDKACTLKLSFLMSLPIVLAGNIVLNLNVSAWPAEAMAGLFFSFVFGLATIHLLLKLAEKINFGYFVLFFGILTLLSAAV